MQDAVGFFCNTHTLLPCGQLVVCWETKVLLCLPAVWSPPYSDACGCSFPGAGLTFPLVQLHEIPLGPFLQAVKVPLNGSMTLRCIRNIIYELAQDALCPITRSSVKMLNSIEHSTNPWDTLLVTDFQLNLVPLITVLLAQ